MEEEDKEEAEEEEVAGMRPDKILTTLTWQVGKNFDKGFDKNRS